jgi:hypothetical protein
VVAPADRTVHASNHEAEIVRYDRAGKWYIEYRDDRPRRRLSLQGAAELAVRLHRDGGVIIAGKPGGRAFDRAVHEVAL